ncbi:hypothetical protein NC99_00500 [Sunxiuqinia dokdonensis]|uniref:Uncharacterized protein n=1 Tax=Sunxiuqinia dokdonensis TaxID=1409788 RepID=A0A0L8VFC4_9BACT|nr:hypothetical protein NC99_00500 [Sunxiuqinia dokdonensis]
MSKSLFITCKNSQSIGLAKRLSNDFIKPLSKLNVQTLPHGHFNPA